MHDGLTIVGDGFLLMATNNLTRMKKISVVDWLNDQLTIEGVSLIPKDVLEVAKKLELIQRIDDYNDGHIDRNKNLYRLPK